VKPMLTDPTLSTGLGLGTLLGSSGSVPASISTLSFKAVGVGVTRSRIGAQRVFVAVGQGVAILIAHRIRRIERIELV